MSIVSTNVPYNSFVFNYNLQELLNTFPFLRFSIIGYSVLGAPIYAIQFGVGKKHVFYSAAYHANEWITSPILMKFIEDISNAYVSNSNLFGYSAKTIFNDTTIHFCPMVNPDGVDLVTGYFSPTSSYYKLAERIAYGFATIPFPDDWKANIRGVDLKTYQPICKVL